MNIPMKLSLQQIKHQFNIKPPGWALRYHAFPRRDPRWRLMLRAYLSGLPKPPLHIEQCIQREGLSNAAEGLSNAAATLKELGQKFNEVAELEGKQR